MRLFRVIVDTCSPKSSCQYYSYPRNIVNQGIESTSCNREVTDDYVKSIAHSLELRLIQVAKKLYHLRQHYSHKVPEAKYIPVRIIFYLEASTILKAVCCVLHNWLEESPNEDVALHVLVLITISLTLHARILFFRP